MELADGVSVEDVVEKTECEFSVADEIKPMGKV